MKIEFLAILLAAETICGSGVGTFRSLGYCGPMMEQEQNYLSTFKRDLWPPVFKNEQLQPLSITNIFRQLKESNPFILVDNFQGIDIKESDYPIVLRRLVPLMPSTSDAYIIWVPAIIATCNTSYTLEKMPCPASKLFTKPVSKEQQRTDQCARLDIFKATISVRPWSGAILIGLLPTDALVYYGGVRRIFRYDVAEPMKIDLDFLDPNSATTVNIIVTSKMQDYFKVHSMYHLMRQLTFADKSFDLQGPFLFRDIFLHAQVSSESSLSRVSLLTSSQPGLHMNMIPVSLKNYYTTTAANLASRALDNTFVATGYSNGESDSDGFYDYLATCPEFYNNRRHLAVGDLQDDHKRLYHIMAQIMIHVMNNDSYVTSPKFRCANGRMETRENDITYYAIWNVKTVPEQIGHSKYHLYFNNPLGILRFVACGQRGIERFPFFDLIGVYDVYVWLWIGIAIFSLPLAIFILNHTLNAIKINLVVSLERSKANERILKFSDNVWYFVKGLLEQGNPFPDHLLKVALFRLTVVAFLLCAIVLSSAYKNDNVYRMITVRLPLLYEKLEQLKNDKFTIYSRISYLNIDIEMLFRSNLTAQLTVEQHMITMCNPFVAAGTEIAALQGTLGINGSSEANIIVTATNASRIHPNVTPLLKHFYHALLPLYASNIIPATVYSRYHFAPDLIEDELKRRFREKEQQWYMKDILSCSKKALILPDYLCNEYARRAEKLGKKMVSVGSEIYGKMSIGMGISGLGPPLVSRRLRNVRESGIVNWLPSLVSNSSRFPYKQTAPGPQSATLNGNIIVIFALLMAGCLISIVSFVAEKIVLIRCKGRGFK